VQRKSSLRTVEGGISADKGMRKEYTAMGGGSKEETE
jgi:hypothetical protein